MDESEDLKSFRKLLGWIAIVVLAMHITLCLVLLIFPRPDTSRTIVRKIYDGYILLGAFFSDDRIQSSTHFYVRHYDQGQWNELTDLSDKFLKDYLKQPWRYHRLVMRDYTREVASDMVKELRKNEFASGKNTIAFNRLHQFVTTALPDIGRSDSIACMTIVKWYIPSNNSFKFDTLFNVKYHTGEVGSFNQ